MRAPEQRQRVVELCVELSRRGFLAGTGGNVALRIDAGHFVVTPSATDYQSMTSADVCVIRLPDLARVEGERAPSVETCLHAQVLRRRLDVHCSIHTHQPVASACALLGRELAVMDEQCRHALGTRVPVVGYMPSGTGLLAAMVGRALRPDINAYLMRNHGALCCGGSIEAAVQAVEALEHLGRRILRQRITARAALDPKHATALARVVQALDHASSSANPNS